VYLKNRASDTQLACELKKSNINAFEEIFKIHHKIIYTRTYAITESKKDTEAIVEKVFIDLWENRFNYNEKDSFKSFLYNIADKCLYSHIKEKLENELTKSLNLQEV
jgi:DNA-directed RNA polymerase specialized sigma24 family protein